MFFSVSKSDLLIRLQGAGRIISRKPVNPIMECFLLRTSGGRLHISAADAAGRIDTSFECTSDEDAAICIKAGMMIDALKEIPEQPVTFHIDTSSLRVQVDYQGGYFEMTGREPALFPEPKGTPDASEIALLPESLLDGIAKVLFCAGNDELRPVLAGVLVETGVSYVATNGHKLAVVEHARREMPEISFVLPSGAASILKNIIPRYNAGGEITVLPGYFNIIFKIGDIQITSVLMEGRYPNFRSVIPKDNDKVVIIDTRLLKDAISRASPFSSESNLVVFEFSTDTVKVSAKNTDFSAGAEETVACEYEGAKFSIGLNGAFMYETLSHIACDRSVLSFSDPGRAILIKPEKTGEGENETYLQMPISIN